MFLTRISRHDLRNHNSDCCNLGSPYPPIEDLVRSAKARYHDDDFPSYRNNNALFGFAIRSHFDQKERSIVQHRCNRTLSRILAMGICDWDKVEKNGVVAKLCQGHSTQRLSACRPLPKCLLVQLETTGRSSWST